jgi:bifunctional enzyme CysN/CysC
LDADVDKKKSKEHLRRLGELSHILLDAGLMVVVTASDLKEEELKLLREIVGRQNMLTIHIGGESGELVDLHLPSDKEIKSNVDNIIELLKFKEKIFKF